MFYTVVTNSSHQQGNNIIPWPLSFSLNLGERANVISAIHAKSTHSFHATDAGDFQLKRIEFFYTRIRMLRQKLRREMKRRGERKD